MKALYITLILCFASILASGQNTREDLDRIFNEAQMDLDADVEAFNEYAEQSLQEYLAFEAKLMEEYEAYKKKVMAEWGEDRMVESTKKTWVEYGQDDTSRSIVDFENGKVTVEILSHPNEDAETTKRRLEEAVANLISSRGKTLGFPSSVAEEAPISDKPIMTGQLNLKSYQSLERGGNLDLTRRTVTTSRQGSSSASTGMTMADKAKKEAQERAARQKAEQEKAAQSKSIQQVIVEKNTPSVASVNTSKGIKNVIKIELELIEDHIPKRAEQFKGMIKKFSKKFTVDEPLIFAIMEQESAFNPAAKSHVPAYGLMQLVPKSGGRDAYRFVHKQDVIPTADFLYDPENNIELGTGYLRLLMTTSFAKVTDPKCRMLCAIAAYNTGAGNVSRSITGNTNISKAIPQINQMNYDQLFNHLKRNLPHAETQDYIQKVTSKMQKYIK